MWLIESILELFLTYLLLAFASDQLISLLLHHFEVSAIVLVLCTFLHSFVQGWRGGLLHLLSLSVTGLLMLMLGLLLVMVLSSSTFPTFEHRWR